MEKTESQKIVEKIKTDKIMPESKFALNWKSYVFWFSWGLMLLLGALFASLAILNFIDIHPDFFRYLGIGKIMHWLVVTAPIFWIVLLVGSIIFGLLAFRKTKRGYRYSLLFVTSLTVLIVSFLGITFHFSKINDHLRKGLFPKGSGMGKIAFPIENRWQEPEEGFLAGEIEEISENSFTLKTPGGSVWTVFYSPETKIINKVIFQVKSEVGLIGEKKCQGEFEAEVIGPFPKREMDFEKHGERESRRDMFMIEEF